LTTPINKTRKLLSYQGFPFPCLPSIEEVNKQLKKNTVECLQHDPLTQPQEYDIEALEILNAEKIYIGMYLIIYYYYYYYYYYYFYNFICLYTLITFSFQGKETLHHLTTTARRKVSATKTTTVNLSTKDVPLREKELRFLFVKFCKKIMDRVVVMKRNYSL
jgi:hypothetical protein